MLSTGFSETTEDTYDIYLLPPGEDPETCSSYLRMRNRDGKYSLMFEVGYLYTPLSELLHVPFGKGGHFWFPGLFLGMFMHLHLYVHALLIGMFNRSPISHITTHNFRSKCAAPWRPDGSWLHHRNNFEASEQGVLR